MKLGDPRTLVLGNTPAPVGVNLDIFPLDAWPAGRIGSAAARLALRVLFRIRWLTYPRSAPAGWSAGKVALLAILTAIQRRFSTRVANRWIESFLRRSRGRRVTVGIYYLGPPAKLDHTGYDEPLGLTFEGRTLPAPADPDAVLTHLYGDWRIPPPPKQRHGPERSAVVWVDQPTVDALRSLAPEIRSTVRDLAALKAIAARAPVRPAAPEAIFSSAPPGAGSSAPGA